MNIFGANFAGIKSNQAAREGPGDPYSEYIKGKINNEFLSRGVAGGVIGGINSLLIYLKNSLRLVRSLIRLTH